MNRKTLGWGVGFAASVALAAMLLVASLRSAPPAEAVARRDAAKVSDIELELILNRIREGDLRALQKDLDGARRAWGEARRMGEGLWPIHEGLADSYARARLHDDALREYAVALPMVPEKLPAMKTAIAAKRAAVLGESGRILEAIRAFLELNQPAQTGARIIDLALKGDREPAVKLVTERAEIHDPRVFLVLSALLQRLERKGEAAEALAKFCIAVAPWDESLIREAIAGLREGKRFDRAIEVCRAWAKAVPGALQPYQAMGDLHREAGREKEAIVAYTSIVDLKPGDAAAHRLLGDIFRDLKRTDDAITQYEAAKKARPEDQVTYSTLVSLYEAKGDGAKAEETLLESMKRFGAQQPDARGRMVALLLDRIAKAKPEEAPALRKKYVDLGIEEAGLFDLKVVMTWDAATHIDLDVVEPGGEKVNHDHDASKAGGKYYMHNTSGYGPETYTLKTAAPGVYRIGAHRHDSAKTTVKFLVILFEGTPREERREATLVMENEPGDQMKVALEVTR